MKILFLINKAGDGGSERFVLDLAEELRSRGAECVLVYGLEGPLAEKARRAGLKTVRIGLDRRDFFSAPRNIAELCRAEGADVIHAQFPRENYYALRSLKYYDKPRVIYTCHWYQDQGSRWRLINRNHSGKLSAAVAVYDGGAQILRANGFTADKIHVIYNGVRPFVAADRAAEDQKDKDVFECCVLSRYSPEKGLDMLLDSVKMLDTAKPFRCTIYGDGELYGHIAGRVKTEGLEGRIVQAGYVQDTRDALTRADLYLSPSEKEGMSLGLLEALAAGKPCVVTDTGASRSVVEDDPCCGICVQPGDPGAFAAAVQRYMDDADLGRAHSEAALIKSERYSLRRMADEYLRLYGNRPDGT